MGIKKKEKYGVHMGLKKWFFYDIISCKLSMSHQSKKNLNWFVICVKEILSFNMKVFFRNDELCYVYNLFWKLNEH